MGDFQTETVKKLDDIEDELDRLKTQDAGVSGPHALLDGSVHDDTVADVVTKGSLVAGNATPAWKELAVGSNDQVLTADSAQALGVKWATPPESYPFLVNRNAANQSINGSTKTLIQWTTASFDLDSGYDAVNYRYIPNRAGYWWLFTMGLILNLDDGEFLNIYIDKNGGTTSQYQKYSSGANFDPSISTFTTQHANGTTDYFDTHILHSHGSALNLAGTIILSFFGGFFLGTGT